MTKYYLTKLIAIFLGIKLAFLISGDFPAVSSPLIMTLMVVIFTSIGYLSCKLIYKGLLLVIEDHRPSVEQDRDPIL